MKEHMYRGVHETSWGGTWFVTLKVQGKPTYLGTFRDIESAARAYDTAALKYHGDKAKLNFPQERPPS
jgi:EREBP-like factor